MPQRGAYYHAAGRGIIVVLDLTSSPDSGAKMILIRPAAMISSRSTPFVMGRQKKAAGPGIGNTQAKSHATSAKIKHTKVRKARQALQKKKQAVASPNLSETNWDDDDDNKEDGSNNNSAEAEEVYGKDQGKDKADYEPKTLGRKDIDINYKASHERKLLLKRLHEALNKDFSHHKTDKLHLLWKAHCESEEADKELEVEYPQIKNLGTLVVTTTGDSQAGPAGPSEPERRSKRALDNQLASLSKRVWLSNNPQANPSTIKPPSSQPPLIAPPSFPTALEPTSRVVYCKLNAPSPSVHPNGPHLSAPTLLARFPTAATLVDNPKTTTARSPPPPPPWVPMLDPRQPPPTPRPLACPAALAPTPWSAAPASWPATPAPAPAPRPPAPAPAPRLSASVSCPAAPASTLAPCLAAPIYCPPAPTPTPAPHTATPLPTLSSRAGTLSSTSFVPTSWSNLHTNAAPTQAPAPHVEQEPGVQPRARAPPYTDLMEDRAEQIAKTEVSRTGRPTLTELAGTPQDKALHTKLFWGPVYACRRHGEAPVRARNCGAWQDVFQYTLPEKELAYLDDDYFAMVANQGATNCGKVLKHVCPISHSMGDFINPPMAEEDAQHNIEQVKVLLPKLFHYKAYAGITDKANKDQVARHNIYDDIPPDVPGPSSPEPANELLPPFDDILPPAEPAEPPEPLLLKPYFPPPPPPRMLLRTGLLLDADGWERYDNELLYGDQELDNKPKPEDEPKPEPEPKFEREYNGHSRLTALTKGKGCTPP
ncbi:hypothetical protein FRC07_014595 [Ceratobasidium sp. 392]|nr:hypothetical protein FRC07_014595 [Ceratobasidium sp. 392]